MKDWMFSQRVAVQLGFKMRMVRKRHSRLRKHLMSKHTGAGKH